MLSHGQSLKACIPVSTLNITDWVVLYFCQYTHTWRHLWGGSQRNPEALNSVQTHFIKPVLSLFNTCLITRSGWQIVMRDTSESVSIYTVWEIIHKDLFKTERFSLGKVYNQKSEISVQTFLNKWSNINLFLEKALYWITAIDSFLSGFITLKR